MIGYGTPASCPFHRCASVPHTSLPRVLSRTAPGSSSGRANARTSSGAPGSGITTAEITLKTVRPDRGSAKPASIPRPVRPIPVPAAVLPRMHSRAVSRYPGPGNRSRRGVASAMLGPERAHKEPEVLELVLQGTVADCLPQAVFQGLERLLDLKIVHLGDDVPQRGRVPRVHRASLVDPSTPRSRIMGINRTASLL